MEKKRERFTAAYQQYVDDIYKFVLVHVNDAGLAEDLTADTFTKAWKHIEAHAFDFKQTRAWLYTIARNLINDHWRKKPVIPLSEDIEIIDEREGHGEIVDRQLQAKRIMKAVKSLPEDMKSVVTLRFLQNLSVKETAKRLDMSESNVRVVQFRALKKLKKVLS